MLNLFCPIPGMRLNKLLSAVTVHGSFSRAVECDIEIQITTKRKF